MQFPVAVPIRIYALAKDLDIDSKDLVEVCNKAGVTGKGSALASLSDDEVEKIKSHLTKKLAPAVPERPSAPERPSSVRSSADRARSVKPAAFSRDDYIAPGGAGSKPPVIIPGKPKNDVGDASKKKSESLKPAPLQTSTARSWSRSVIRPALLAKDRRLPACLTTKSKRSSRT